MEEKSSCIMMCDRIEEGCFCVLVGDGGKVLSLPVESLSVTPIEKEVYTVEIDEDGNVKLTPAPKEKEKRLARIRALRRRLMRGRERKEDIQK